MIELEKIYYGTLLLVNAHYPLRSNNMKSLVPADVRFPDILMKRDAANALQLILEKITAGNSIVPVSGYRSSEEQKAIICDEFRKAAPDYGFIQRYAKNKEEITGISHEPWHFRYVGYPHSRIIKDNGFSFEEYTEFIKAYRDDCRFVYREALGTEVELYYIPVNDDKTQIDIPEECVYQISGNNIDGFIVNVWRKNHD